MKRAFAPLLVVVAAALWACPDQLGQQCPTGTAVIGQYNLGLTKVTPDAGPECYYSVALADGGLADAGPLGIANPAPLTVGLCGGAPLADGGQQVWLVSDGKALRRSDVSADGGVTFTTSSAPTSGFQPCTCDVSFGETLTGFLRTSSGTFALDADGGLPDITGIAGDLVDTVSPAGSGCTCNAPCAIAYSVDGGRL